MYILYMFKWELFEDAGLGGALCVLYTYVCMNVCICVTGRSNLLKVEDWIYEDEMIRLKHDVKSILRKCIKSDPKVT